MIRMQERLQGTWSAEDEERYVEALEAALDKMTREACNG
jgi:SPX domain protein involved in polyphosphate accumulation